MTVRTRADLDALPSYVPGKTVPGAIKLASNEVSAGPLPSVVRAVAEAATAMNRYPDTGCTDLVNRLPGQPRRPARAAPAMNRYPDTGCTDLVNRLADKLGVPAERIATGSGSVTLCQQLIQATC